MFYLENAEVELNFRVIVFKDEKSETGFRFFGDFIRKDNSMGDGIECEDPDSVSIFFHENLVKNISTL